VNLGYFHPCPSVITSKPAIGYHFKTGQRNHTQDQMMFYRAGRHSGKYFHFSMQPRALQGDRARGISAERFEIPLAGGGA
jgi:hypothetical protein